MREGWFKMRSDHRKTEGATRFDLHEHIGKVQTGIRAKRRSHGSCKRPGESIEKSKEGSHNLNNLKFQFEWLGVLRVLNYKE